MKNALILAALGASVSATCGYGKIDAVARYMPAWEDLDNCDTDDNGSISRGEWYACLASGVDPKNEKMFDRKFNEIFDYFDVDFDDVLDIGEAADWYFCMNQEEDYIVYP